MHCNNMCILPCSNNVNASKMLFLYLNVLWNCYIFLSSCDRALCLIDVLRFLLPQRIIHCMWLCVIKSQNPTRLCSDSWLTHYSSSIVLLRVEAATAFSVCFQRVLAIAILYVRPSVTRVDQSKAEQARITKSSLLAPWKTLVSEAVKLFHKFEGHPEWGC